MIALIQRVRQASVHSEGQLLGEIDRGVLAFLCVEPADSEIQCQRMLDRLLGYRIFADAEGRMNLSLQDVDAGLLLVPQFTLAADTRKGMRPSFSNNAPSELGARLFALMVASARARWYKVAEGRFGADMQVSLVNDGPVTFWLRN